MANKTKDESQETPQRPAQVQERQAGLQEKMTPRPVSEAPNLRGSGKLHGRIALITGGDSGIGRAVAMAFAREGADVAILYLDEHEDAAETVRLVEEKGRQCLSFPCDIGIKERCDEMVALTVRALGGIDILVNNAAEQHPRESITDISEEQIEKTFRTNVFSMFFLTAAALPHLRGAPLPGHHKHHLSDCISR